MTTTYNRITSQGTYTCGICSKLTRDTGHGEADIGGGYCKKCMYLCYMDNALNDYGVESTQYAEAKANYEACK